MTLEIPETRPRVWSRDLSRDIDELRRFRHAFRHIYDSRIEPDKLMIAQSRVARRKPIVAGPPHGRGRLKGTDER